MAYRWRPGMASQTQTEREPERVQPVPEHYEGVNFPYRGTEQHGVEVPHGAKYDDYPNQYAEEAPERYEAPLPEHDPILVRVVNEHARERRMWRAIRCQGSQNPIQILGRNDARTNMRIRNLDTVNAVYIGSDANVTNYTGYKIPAGTELFPFTSQEAVYALTGDATVVELAVMYEYAVEL